MVFFFDLAAAIFGESSAFSRIARRIRDRETGVIPRKDAMCRWLTRSIRPGNLSRNHRYRSVAVQLIHNIALKRAAFRYFLVVYCISDAKISPVWVVHAGDIRSLYDLNTIRSLLSPMKISWLVQKADHRQCVPLGSRFEGHVIGMLLNKLHSVSLHLHLGILHGVHPT